MVIPTITFPTTYDSDSTLFSVKDSAYLKLIKDYNPSDKQIFVEANSDKMILFPPTGLITLTEQCSDPELRALSFYYGGRTTSSFFDLTLLDGFVDSYKPANATNVFMNVMAQHHNNIKDAVIAIEKYVGVKGDISYRPLDPDSNLEQRTNYLLSVVFQPKAWFSANKTIGLTPLSITFTNQSLRMGEILPDNNIQYFWDFGDNTSSNITYIEETSTVPSQETNVIVEDLDGGTIQKTYTKPGIYSVSLTSKNKYGQDVILIKNMINVKYPAPLDAIIQALPISTQIYNPVLNFIKTTTNILVNLQISSGQQIINGRTYNYAGEELDSNNNPIDPILTYTWELADNLGHANSNSTRALYTIGGLYDVVLRVDTATEAYKITTYNSFVNVVERSNLWLFSFLGTSNATIQASEMGLISETWKTKQITSYSINRDYSFLENQNNSDQMVREFKKNTNFTIRSSNPSGVGGTAIIHYATGSSTIFSNTEEIAAIEYNGFAETYEVFNSVTILRPWNWIALNFGNISYFILGNIAYIGSKPSGLSLTNSDMLYQNLINKTTGINPFSSTDFIGLASELKYNIAQFDTQGNEFYGYFSTYRSAWRDRNGYILKNDGVGTSFRIRSFYTTYENGSDIIAGFKKLPDILGPTKYEGILLNLASNLFFFNNTGAISAYDAVTNTWKTGGPGYNSIVFRELQDTTVQNSDNEKYALLGTTDSSNNAYLSFDYSADSYIKFNDIDLTFSKMPERPMGNQWVFGNY